MSLSVGENSYVTVDEAGAYFADHLFSDEWELSPDKEKLLIAATRRIDRLPIKGIKADRTQALEFPRAIYSYSRGINPYHDLFLDNLHMLPRSRSKSQKSWSEYLREVGPSSEKVDPNPKKVGPIIIEKLDQIQEKSVQISKKSVRIQKKSVQIREKSVRTPNPVNSKLSNDVLLQNFSVPSLSGVIPCPT